MDILQIALTILVSLWTIIFLFIAIAAYLIYRSIKRAMDKVNNIIDATEEIAENARIPSKVVIATIVGFLAKSSVEGLKNLITGMAGKKRK